MTLNTELFNRFKNRVQAGRLLASKLFEYRANPNALVLGLPRGGVPVAFEIARELKLSLDVFLVRKLGVPGQEEFAMGAIASNSDPAFQQHILRQLNISSEEIEEVVTRQKLELVRRENMYRKNKQPLKLTGKIIIVVDDGAATGSTMIAALQAIRHQNPAKLIAAVPVSSSDALTQMRELTDEVVCLKVPQPFYSVGYWYEDFVQITDEEVLGWLQQSA